MYKPKDKRPQKTKDVCFESLELKSDKQNDWGFSCGQYGRNGEFLDSLMAEWRVGLVCCLGKWNMLFLWSVYGYKYISIYIYI